MHAPHSSMTQRGFATTTAMLDLSSNSFCGSFWEAQKTLTGVVEAALGDQVVGTDAGAGRAGAAGVDARAGPAQIDEQNLARHHA